MLNTCIYVLCNVILCVVIIDSINVIINANNNVLFNPFLYTNYSVDIILF